MPRPKKVKVVHRKLGREQADGQAFKDERIVELDERLKGKEYLETAIHEFTHIHKPDWSEEEVDTLSKKLTADLWGLGFRRVDEG